MVGITRSCGYGWLKKWNSLGTLSLSYKKRPGRPPKSPVPKSQIEDLIKKASSLSSARDQIRESFGVDYSYRHLSRIRRKPANMEKESVRK